MQRLILTHLCWVLVSSAAPFDITACYEWFCYLLTFYLFGSARATWTSLLLLFVPPNFPSGCQSRPSPCNQVGYIYERRKLINLWDTTDIHWSQNIALLWCVWRMDTAKKPQNLLFFRLVSIFDSPLGSKPTSSTFYFFQKDRFDG